MHFTINRGSLCDLQTLRTSEKIKRPLKKMAKIGILYGYKIRLNKIAWNGKHSYCNLEYTGKNSDYVYGIILYLTKKELQSVNAREGFISNGNDANSYNRFKLLIVTPNGIEKTYVYIGHPKKTSNEDLVTTKFYATHIINGLHFLMCQDKNIHFSKTKNIFKIWKFIIEQ